MTLKSKQKKPGADISPEEKAALLAFCRQVKSLSAPKGDDITVWCNVDLSARYKKTVQEIKAYKGLVDIGVGNKIHSSVFKAVPKAPKNMKARVSLTRESVNLAGQILEETVRRCSQRCEDRRGLESLIKRCGSTLTEFANASNDGFSWAQVAAFFQNAASFAGLTVEELVSETNLGSTFTRLKSGLANGLISLLQSGDATATRQLLGACTRHSELDEACRGILQKALSENASTLPRESQQVAIRFLGVSVQSEQVDYANPAESPEIRQAAALLLYLFDLRQHTPELEEAFERYRIVAEQQFNLCLRGVVGSTLTFDRRLHEPPESGEPGPQVRVIRPWVEWYKPPDARVVIRGIVEPEMVVGGDGK